jgi:hypothetical protein
VVAVTWQADGVLGAGGRKLNAAICDGGGSGWAGVARAGAGDGLLKVDDVVANRGTTGSFDVYFLEPVPDAGSENLAAYNIRLDLTPQAGAAGVTITSVSRTDAAGLHPPVLPAGVSLFSTTGTNSTSGRASSDVGAGDEQDIDNLEGVLRVFYSVDAAAMGVYSLTINPVTQFTSGTQQTIPFSPLSGTFTVSVPEPTGAITPGILGTLAVLRRRGRRV